ncbi:uncharacterized protein LOC133837112 [Drosophila sulfurigaster albostrigata]|uniref:uncharacterized protein LOC133837112 n=1 Tax=Drosophila sulfurigaster albostrigata TaxID=89887 RepID=UPI002D21BD81|nr:uncharacterized protein LOC133837112 [Drosophila sulfurigaster albostrigata]
MLSSGSDKFYPTMKCEMCPKIVANFVFGLCERCVAIWTSQRNVEDLHITMDNVNAILVEMAQDKKYYDDMDQTFRRFLEEQMRRRKKKVDLFQNMRENFQTSLIMTNKRTVCRLPFKTEDNYWELNECKCEKLFEIPPDGLRSIHSEYITNFN